MGTRNYDVRIATYKTGKGDMKVISFSDGLGDLLDSERIIPQGKGSKLYFRPDSRGFKLSVSARSNVHSLQIANGDWVRSLKKFEGQYNLEFDSEFKLYYIDQEKASILETTKAYGVSRGTKKNNYKSHPRGPSIPSPGEVKNTSATVKNPVKLSNTVEEEPKSMPQPSVSDWHVEALLMFAIEQWGAGNMLKCISALDMAKDEIIRNGGKK